MDWSLHSTLRAAQRNLSKEDVAYILCYGQRFHRAGALIIFLRRRDIPAWDRVLDDYARLEGTALVLSRDGRVLVTVWRNPRGLKRIRARRVSVTRRRDGPEWEEAWGR